MVEVFCAHDAVGTWRLLHRSRLVIMEELRVLVRCSCEYGRRSSVLPRGSIGEINKDSEFLRVLKTHVYIRSRVSA